MRILYLFCAVLMAATSASAELTFYKCSYNGRGAKGWIMQEAVYGIDATSSIAVVSDPFVLYANDGEPMVVDLDEKRKNAFVLRYPLQLPARGNKLVTALYRVRLDTARMRASVRVQPGNSDVPDTGAANCVVIPKRK